MIKDKPLNKSNYYTEQHTRLNAYRPEIKPMKILVKMPDGRFQVEVVNSVDEAQGLCRKMGAENWDHIGWVEKAASC
jgi:hypothetical protein